MSAEITNKELQELVTRLYTRQAETERTLQQVIRQILLLSKKLETPWDQDNFKLPQKSEEPLELPFYRSLREIIERYFQASMTSDGTQNSRLGISVSGYGYSSSEAYLGQYYGQLRHGDLDQVLKILENSRKIFSEIEGKKVYGILAVDELADDVRARVVREGLYLAIRHEDLYELIIPEGFQSRTF